MLNTLTGKPLVIDSGNALFRSLGGASEEDKKRASFVLSTMGALGTNVLGVGHRDLSAGPEFLIAEAKKANVQLVATNLELEGKPAFPKSVVVEKNGVKVAVLSVTGLGPVPGVLGLMGTAQLPALQAELKKLPARDLTVVLCTSGYEEAMALAGALDTSVDFVIQSGEFRGTVPPQKVKDTFLLASGQRGQAVAKLELSFGKTKGAFADLNEAARDQELLTNLENQLKSVDERLKLAKDPEGKKALEGLRKDMKGRRDEQARRLTRAVGGRTLKLDWLMLGQDVKDDESLKAEVLKIEPTYSGLH
ncbi:MAG: hypothetical protein JNM69_30590 [Archangium sp.]|nr:hypothetical protein [Archangium sp.]